MVIAICDSVSVLMCARARSGDDVPDVELIVGGVSDVQCSIAAAQ